MIVLLWAARVGLVLIGLFWLVTAFRVWRKRAAATWRIGPDSPGPGAPVSVSIVIPARNEVDNIEGCVQAALAQDLDDLQVVVLDDGSTDGTSDILARLAEQAGDRLVVLKGGDQPLPDGWLGKPWACQRAAQAATGDWLLFIDADVRLHPHAAAAAVAWGMDHDLGMISGLGHLDTQSFWEKVMQPVVGALIMAGNDLDVVNDPERRSDRPLANGQFILLRRTAWDAVGGHAAVKGAVLDDVGMATAVVGAGLPYNVLMMRELFYCRMYDSLGALWEGWTKNLFTGLRRSFRDLVLLSLIMSVLNLLPFVLLVLGLVGVVGPEWLWWGAGLSVTVVAVRGWLDHAYDMDIRYGVTQPLAVALLIVLLWHSAIRTVRGTTKWKGRTLSLDPGEATTTTTAVASQREEAAQPAGSPESSGTA